MPISVWLHINLSGSVNVVKSTEPLRIRWAVHSPSLKGQDLVVAHSHGVVAYPWTMVPDGLLLVGS